MKEKILKLLAKYVEIDVNNGRTILADDHFNKVADELIDHFKNLGEQIASEGEQLDRCCAHVSKIDNEIIVQFSDGKELELFITQMMDGFGENYCNFTWWHKQGDEYIHKYDKEGRVICKVSDIDANF